MVNEYERFRESPGQRSTTFGGNLRQGILPPTPAILDGSVAGKESQIDSLQSARTTKLKLLAELETMITEDISANDLELDETKNGSGSILPERKFILLDRKYDLEKVLREIQALQLFVISEEISEVNLDQDTELLPFGYSAFNNQPNLSASHV